MNFFKKTHGGVSIFLTIILVPVIAVCTIFIDVSRVYLGSDLAASSADLSLNTVMSQYDVDLEQYYGMMASCQNVEEFYDVAEEYFAACMQSQGVAATDSQEWAQKLREILGGNVTYDDLIRIDDSNTTAEITSLDDADLANAAMVKQQITEFMKYRAPVDLISNAMDTDYTGLYSKFKEVGENAKNLPYEADVQDKKTKYYTAENELLQKALEAYEILEDYEALQIDDEYIIKTKTCYENLENSFTELHADYIEYWSNIEWKWTDSEMKKASDLTSGAIDEATTYEEATVSADDLKEQIKKVENATKNFEKKRADIIAKFNETDYCDLEYDAVSKAQYWLHIEHILSKGSNDYSSSLYKEYIDYYREMIKEWKTLENAYNYRIGGPNDENEENDDVNSESYESDKTIEDAYNNAEGMYTTACTDDATNRIEAVTNRAATYYSDTIMMVDVTYANSSIKSKVQSDSDSKDDELLKERYERLNKGKALIDDLKDAVDAMGDLADAYHSAYDTWKTSVEVSEGAGIDSEVIKQSRDEITEIEENDDAIEGTVNYKENVNVAIEKKDCDDFSTILSNVSGLLDSYISVAKSIKYHGTCILGTDITEMDFDSPRGINTLERFDNAAKNAGTTEKRVDNGSVPVKTDELTSYINTTWEFDDSAIDTIVELIEDNSPCFHNSNTYNDATSIRKIDKFLHRQFDNIDITDEKKSEKTKGILETIKELVKNPLPDGWEGYDNIHNSDNEIKEESGLPSESSAENTDPLVGGLSKNDDVTKETESTLSMANALQEIVAIIEDVGLAARDNLYTTDYVMNMFSYETHYMETVYGQTRANMESSDAKSANIYNVGLDEAIKPGNAKNLFDTETAWNIMKDDDLTKTYNKSLTNRIINKMDGDSNDGITPTSSGNTDENGKLNQEFTGNNWSYGNEIEYILSGSDNETNKNRIEAVLYFIRYAFNFAPVFQGYWENTIVEKTAEGVAIATAGVIPVPLTKLIICMGICSAESAVDESYILAGLPVKLVKEKDSLFIDFNIGYKELTEKIKSKDSSGSIFKIGENSVPDTSLVLSYSDYLSIFVYLGLITNADNMYKRIADVIQVNMSKNPNIDSYSESGFNMSNAKTYFQIKTKVKIKPMMVALPYGVQYGTDSLLEIDNWNSFTYKTIEGY